MVNEYGVLVTVEIVNAKVNKVLKPALIFVQPKGRSQIQTVIIGQSVIMFFCINRDFLAIVIIEGRWRRERGTGIENPVYSQIDPECNVIA